MSRCTLEHAFIRQHWHTTWRELSATAFGVSVARNKRARVEAIAALCVLSRRWMGKVAMHAVVQRTPGKAYSNGNGTTRCSVMARAPASSTSCASQQTCGPTMPVGGAPSRMHERK
jgi:hypothetical protein